jgi:hypothetical protein
MINFEREEIETLLNNNQVHSETPVCAFLEKEVTDFTDIIPSTGKKNSFIFNNSMIHWKDDLFLCTYRLVYIDSPKTFKNPLEIWYEMWNLEGKNDHLLDSSNYRSSNYRSSNYPLLLN